MKYVVTGGAGNITRPLAEKLLAAGHQVIVIGRNAENLVSLTEKGATAAIGSVEDTGFLKKVFFDADAVYTMVPPKYDIAGNWKDHIGQIGKNYRDAIRGSSVKYIVNLSSIGAHLADGCGPVSGLYKVEAALNELKDVNIKHLRPSYFFANLLANVGLAKNMNIIGSNFGGDNFKLVLTDTSDIVAAATEELLQHKFTGHSVRYIASDERSTDEIAKMIGDSIGKPQLPWVLFTDDQAFGGMKQAGLPEEIARNYTEMGHAIHTGVMQEDYWKNHPAALGKVKLEDFVKTFTAVYNAS
ncbi:MAG TPA: NAD(P)H-binding protein [Chitinophagaceae bacterium]